VRRLFNSLAPPIGATSKSAVSASFLRSHFCSKSNLELRSRLALRGEGEKAGWVESSSPTANASTETTKQGWDAIDPPNHKQLESRVVCGRQKTELLEDDFCVHNQSFSNTVDVTSHAQWLWDCGRP
jgi:hypothetical protein